MAQRQIIGGAFQDALGNALASGFMTFRLSTDAVTDSGEQIVAGRVVRVNLDSNGSVSGTINMWPNDQMTPIDTTYIVRVFNSKGQVGWQSEQLIPSGVGSYDITAWVA